MLLDDFINKETIGNYNGPQRDAEFNILNVAVARAVRELYIPNLLDFQK